MKKILVILLSLLTCGISLAEDAVSSATLSLDHLPSVESAGSNILVVYFSTDDTIRAAAYIIAEALSADLFEIQPVEPYTADDVNYHNSRSRTSIEQNDPQARPAIAVLPDDLNRYDTIILGYPIWWGQAPRILYTFMENVDLTGKTIIPFCTSGSSGAGSSASNLQKLTGGSTVWLDAKRISNGSSAEEIRAWAESLRLPKEEIGMFYIHVHEAVLAVKAENNSSSEALLQLLKAGDITISMHDYGNFEKVGPLGISIPRNDEDITTTPGDVILYQGNQVTVYYDENRWDFTKLGHIDIDQDELKSILGSGDVTVVLSVNP
ncbi:MAG: NAD(P)H-dependent oxidoreductase [Clostridia bacterium]|nr:NAD(P)H-dependent oxidoreductase [Clostridia bacterium]